MGGNNLSVPLDHAKKTGVLSLRDKKLEKVSVARWVARWVAR